MIEISADQQWQPPAAATETAKVGSQGVLGELAQSTYNFIQGGIAGGLGAYVSSSSRQR